ncbi:MAG: SDR family NAD(P)-dependent oxidoreductase, partial [Dietzia cercidiphylli]
MDLTNASALVTGGASGLGRATVARFVDAGVPTVLVDLPSSNGQQVAEEFGDLVTFAPADVADPEEITAAVRAAAERAPPRAGGAGGGRGRTVRVVDREGEPGSLEDFELVVRVNLLGSFNVLRIAAAEMAENDPVDGERGVVVMTASVAAWEGQIGQMPYSASKAG